MASAGSDHTMSGQHAQRLASLAVRLQESQAVAYEAWRRIAASRRRIYRLAPIAGGSTDRLREDIRRRLAEGALPRTSGHAWIGPARGDRRCACCLKIIAAPLPEYAVRDRAELHAHAGCFGLWVEESAGRETPRGWWAPRDIDARQPRAPGGAPGSRSASARRGRAR